MRTRTQVTEDISSNVAPFSQTWVGHNTYTVPGGTLVRASYASETMSDDSSKSRRFKAVTHEKYACSRSSISSSSLVSGSDTFNSTGSNCFWHIWGLGSVPFVEHKHISKLFTTGESQLVRETMDLFYNANEVDNLLNVVESPELITSLKSLYERVISVKTYGKLSSRNGKKALRDAFVQNSSILSGGYLYYKFGVAPLISDMRKIATNLEKYQKAFRKYKKHAGTPISVHRTITGSFGPIVADGNGNLPSGFGLVADAGKSWTASVNSLIQPKLTCTIRGIREFKYSTESFRALDYLISRFGVTGPASFLWERIPFSFVVDWFVDLSGVLNAADNALTGNAKKITDAGISQSWMCGLPIVKLRQSPTLTDSNDGSQIAYVVLRSFIRKPTIPTVSVGLSGRFGKNQLGITAALVSQMAANLVSRRGA
jgi:hypothetical protein